MKRLPEVVKKRIVEHLACFRRVPEVVDLIEEEFGVTLTPRHIRAYDPESPRFVAAARWLEHHHLVRERYREKIGEIPIAHRAYRLDQLQRAVDAASRRIDRGGKEALEAIEQLRRALETAAKEVGDWYQR